jgi:hypothetical protein
MMNYSLLAAAPLTGMVPHPVIVTTPTPLNAATAREIGKASAITLAVGLSPLALYYGGAAFIRWIAAYPVLINLINSMGQGPGTPSLGGASEEALAQIAQGKSMGAAVVALNEAGATQAQAVNALTQVVSNAGKDLIAGSLEGAPGSIVLSGVQFAPGGLTQAIVVSPAGVATLGSGTVTTFNPLTGTLVISNFVPR